ncbi:MAG: adenylate/guanylate cyclase domain-containing protein [Eubacteriales bacterium]
MRLYKIKSKNKYMGVKIALSLLMTAIFFLIYATDIFEESSWSLSDMFFQEEGVASEEIVVIGVTSEDLDNYGMWPWDRTTWAKVLETINSDEETKPAAIGVDISFFGSSQPTSDEKLTEQITVDNVVLSCDAEFKSEIVVGENHSVQQYDYIVSSISYPYIYPNENINLGHTNYLFDNDGIVRNGLLEIETEQGAVIGSMAYETFQIYNQYYGQETTFEPVVDENGFWYVDYTATAGEYFQYSITDILDGNFNQEDLTGKIVLIGVYDATLMDYYRVSLDHSENMYGVEITANCINAMINDSEVAMVAGTTELIALLVSTFVITFVALQFSFAFVTGFVITMLIIGLYIISFAYNQGILYPPFYFVTGLGACYILSVAFNYWFEWYTKKHVTKVFKQYVDPKVMEKLIHNKLSTLDRSGTSCEIAVLFVDLRGFTGMSEQLQPDLVVGLLNEFLTMVDECINKFDGTLDKFIGDCAMAFWGAPEPKKNPSYDACCAAVEMIRSVEILNKEIERKYKLNISFGVGIHFGTAIVGSVGSTTRLDYTAIGDTVNTASRLESNAPKNTIYISESVAEHVKDLVVMEKLQDKMQLKGKLEPVDIYILKDINDSNQGGL